MSDSVEDEKIARRMQALLETMDLGAVHLGLYYGDELCQERCPVRLPAVTSEGYRKIFMFDVPLWAKQLQSLRWEVRLSSMDAIELASLDVTAHAWQKYHIAVRITSDMKVELCAK